MTASNQRTPSRASRIISRQLSNDLLRASREGVAGVLVRLRSREEGLSSSEVAHDKMLPCWTQLWQSYRNPFNLRLSVLAGVALATGDMIPADCPVLAAKDLFVSQAALRGRQSARPG